VKYRGIFVNSGPVGNESYLSIFTTRSRHLEKSYKFIENQKNANPFLLVSVRLGLQLVKRMTILLTYTF
jgi:hypothetical protein